MSIFSRALRDCNPRDRSNRDWVFVAYDQLCGELGRLATTSPDKLGLVFVETTWKPARRPYHKQKLAFVLANMRNFALEQARRGVAVDYLTGEAPYDEFLREWMENNGALSCIEPAERELRALLKPLAAEAPLTIEPNPAWLTTADDFDSSQAAEPPWRMDRFYKHVRRRTGILMTEDGKPLGGKFSLDAENRQPWNGEPSTPLLPTFAPNPITDEVIALVNDKFEHHPGQVNAELLPSTKGDAEEAWCWALSECMTSFGPFEDAMSSDSSGLFHTRISMLLNVGRLTPARVVRDVAALTSADVPLSSIEGFIRQVLGWREFVRHVHLRTDGFRVLPSGTAQSTGGDALPNHLSATRALPPAYWGRPSGLACLDTVVSDVWTEAYSHHITRLMILSNIATLLDVDPRELTDWFWIAYADAYDWVVEPNVLAMGTFAVGELMTTKPYISGANYISKMSNYCGACQFKPKSNCPITPMYWAFLERHRETLSGNHRLQMPLASVKRRTDEKKARDKRVFERVAVALGAGHRLDVGVDLAEPFPETAEGDGSP